MFNWLFSPKPGTRIEESGCLTLGDLQIGDKFIFFPRSEREFNVIFTKIQPYQQQLFGKAFKITCENYLGLPSSMSLDSKVLRIMQ